MWDWVIVLLAIFSEFSPLVAPPMDGCCVREMAEVTEKALIRG